VRGRRSDVRQLLDVLQQGAPERVKVVTNAVGIKLVLIPSNTFWMGSLETEPGRRPGEGPRREVTISEPFYLAVHPVTQGQYETVMGHNPSRFNRTCGGGPDFPVESVTWEEAVAFTTKLGALPEEKQAARTYRLPTEAEWECACRAGTTTAYSCGEELPIGQANYGADDDARRQTTPVGAYPANLFGLYDQHGNVWEWCADWFLDHYYRLAPMRDPRGPTTGELRVVRGGSWRNHAGTCRSAYRNAFVPHNRDAATGFRVAASLGR
jgi:formylglycine-generating enzyme required for sulfatase activity